MFVRKKKNRSGSVSIAVVDKSKGRYMEIRQFGVAHTEAEVNALVRQANDWIRRYAGQRLIDFEGMLTVLMVETWISRALFVRQ